MIHYQSRDKVRFRKGQRAMISNIQTDITLLICLLRGEMRSCLNLGVSAQKLELQAIGIRKSKVLKRSIERFLWWIQLDRVQNNKYWSILIKLRAISSINIKLHCRMWLWLSKILVKIEIDYYSPCKILLLIEDFSW